MSGKYDLITDDQVAELLSKEASDYQLRYSSMGLAAGRGRPKNHPTPNQRFLKNIIRDTQSHNAALLAKETAESQARLHELEDVAEKNRRKLNPTSSDIRRQQLRRISAALGAGSGPSRTRKAASAKEKAEGGSPMSRGPQDDESGSSGRPQPPSREDPGRHASHKRRRRSRDPSSSSAESEDDRGHSKPHRSSRSTTHKRRDREEELRGGSRSPDQAKRRRGDRSRSRSRSPRREKDKRPHRQRERRRSVERAAEATRNRRRGHDDDDGEDGEGGEGEEHAGADSDPLDEFIGPAPPPASGRSRHGVPELRIRGRAAAQGRLDKVFAADYDPALDLAPPEDLLVGGGGGGGGENGKRGKGGAGKGEDWDEAVEAFRDSIKWKSAQSSRLREAGFTEDEVKKWEAAGKEKSEADVKWSKKGEVREWDRGK